MATMSLPIHDPATWSDFLFAGKHDRELTQVVDELRSHSDPISRARLGQVLYHLGQVQEAVTLLEDAEDGLEYAVLCEALGMQRTQQGYLRILNGRQRISTPFRNVTDWEAQLRLTYMLGSAAYFLKDFATSRVHFGQARTYAMDLAMPHLYRAAGDGQAQAQGTELDARAEVHRLRGLLADQEHMTPRFRQHVYSHLALRLAELGDYTTLVSMRDQFTEVGLGWMTVAATVIQHPRTVAEVPEDHPLGALARAVNLAWQASAADAVLDRDTARIIRDRMLGLSVDWTGFDDWHGVRRELDLICAFTHLRLGERKAALIRLRRTPQGTQPHLNVYENALHLAIHPEVGVQDAESVNRLTAALGFTPYRSVVMQRLALLHPALVVALGVLDVEPDTVNAVLRSIAIVRSDGASYKGHRISGFPRTPEAAHALWDAQTASHLDDYARQTLSRARRALRAEQVEILAFQAEVDEVLKSLSGIQSHQA